MNTRFTLILLSACFTISCGKKLDLIDYIPYPQQTECSFQFEEASTVLGDTIEIPYSIENLTKALEYLPPETKATIREEDYAPTHYYVRFAPKNIEELDILINLTPRIFLSEVPLDREIVTGGVYYHDPEIPEDRPTYQYSTISIERWEELDTLSVAHEVLIRAYMPDYDDFNSTETKAGNTFVIRPEIEALLREAYRMTGYKYECEPVTKGATWYPSGYIKAYDDKAGIVPIAKVRVRGTHFLKVKEALTNGSGYFHLDSFNSSVTLKVIWESDDWDIRHGIVGQATYDGPTLNQTMWNLTIPSDQTWSVHHATMHRAAHRMYYGNIKNLHRVSLSRKLKMAYMANGINNGTQGGLFNHNNVGGTLPDIQIAGIDASSTRPASIVLSSTFHELGHASHYTNEQTSYIHSTDQLLESWAKFVQYILTIQEYTELNCVSSLFTYDINNRMIPDNKFNFQILFIDDHFMVYTPLFIDLYDDYNQWDYFNRDPYPNDVVSGMLPTLLEDIVYNSVNFYWVADHLRTYADDNPNNLYNLNQSTITEILQPYYGHYEM